MLLLLYWESFERIFESMALVSSWIFWTSASGKESKLESLESETKDSDRWRVREAGIVGELSWFIRVGTAVSVTLQLFLIIVKNYCG